MAPDREGAAVTKMRMTRGAPIPWQAWVAIAAWPVIIAATAAIVYYAGPWLIPLAAGAMTLERSTRPAGIVLLTSWGAWGWIA